MKKVLMLSLVALTLSCKSPEARPPVSVKTGSFIDASVERNKRLIEHEHQIIKDLIANTPGANYAISDDGFWYQYDVKVDDNTVTPQFGDIVNFEYNIAHLNGQTIYSLEELQARDYAMDKEELFSGLREGLKLMKAGETVTFLFPSQKAFGYYGDSNRIGTSVPLKCTVTINTITQKETN